MEIEQQKTGIFGCPYCHGVLEIGVISCRHCSRDLAPVLPLLLRISKLEGRLSEIDVLLKSQSAGQFLLPSPVSEPANVPFVIGQRRFWPLPIGLGVLLLAYCAIVLWLDLPLSLLRMSSIVIPLTAGFAYFGERYKFQRLDLTVAIAFSAISVLLMNIILGFVDSIPVLPQGIAAWRETMYYVLSIAISMISGMLLRMSIMALGSRGLTSLPQLRQGLLSVNKSIPTETLKAIELAVLLIGSLVSAIAGLFAGIVGLSG